MGLQTLWEMTFFLRLEVGRWPSDIGGTVGPPLQQLGFVFQNAYRYSEEWTLLIDTWFVLSTSIKYVGILLPFNNKKYY